MASSLAFALAQRMDHVHAVTSAHLYERPEITLPSRENIHGVEVHRLSTCRFGRRTLLRRAVDDLTFYASVFLWILRFAQPGDRLIVATDPPLLSILALIATKLSGSERINWLHDFYPEIAVALGVLPRGAASRLLQTLRDRALASAAMNVVIGERMAGYLRMRGIAAKRIAVIHNWADGAAIKPVAVRFNSLRRHWGLEGKFIVGYSGNLGRGHEFETILGAALALGHDSNIIFLFIGGGHRLSWFREQVRSRGLTNVLIKPFQPETQLSESLSLPDLHLVCLQPALEGLMVPSKFYGVAAAGRPTLFIGDVKGEIPAILRAADCGTAVSVGDADGLAEYILRLRNEPALAERLGENARNVFCRHFERSHAIEAWCEVLRDVVPVQHGRGRRPIRRRDRGLPQDGGGA
jgi:glycosyltransferase involved in cell wall biosynthesis